MARQRTMPGVQWQKAGAGDAIAGQAAAKPGTGLPQAVRWHMIGHLQRNKARKAVEICRLIHSVDSLRLVEELQLIGLKREKPIEVLLQVNCSLEAQKYGCAIAATAHLAESIETMVHVQVRGLMTMAAQQATPDEVRKTFERCRELFEEIRESGVAGSRFNILSMGMSGDYEMAIEEGANLVRVGTALFGEAKPGMDDASEDDDED
jgi:pyridoxal phosphate enzyme (YggS family)